MKKIKRVALFTVALTTLGACTMIPDYMRPDFSASPTWPERPEYITTEGARSAAEITWQEFFKSTELQKVIQTALENNRNLKTAALNIEEARATYRIERSDLFPTINANGDATIQQTPDAASTVPGRGGGRVEFYQANAGLSSYEIDLFGRLRSMNEAALNEFFATQEARNAVRNSLIAETANAYLQYLADKKLLEITQQTLEAQEETFDLLSRSRDSGVATDLDVARAATAVETARVNQAVYKRFIAQDINALVLLMGIPQNQVDIPESSLSDIEIMRDLPVGLPSEVLLNRPDIRQAEYQLRARNADIGAARAAFFPRVSLTGTYGFASSDLNSLFSSDATPAWSLIPQITMPIFTGGANKATLELAEIRKDSAIIEYERTIQAAFRDIADELAARNTLTEQLEAQQRLVDASSRAYDISDARYRSGIDNFLGVLDAQRELYTAQQNMVTIERQRLSNLVDLYRALGGGTLRQSESENVTANKTAEPFNAGTAITATSEKSGKEVNTLDEFTQPGGNPFDVPEDQDPQTETTPVPPEANRG